MNYLFHDIETMPDMDQDMEALAASIAAPKNYKDPAKIAAYKAEKAHEAWTKQALNWRKGRICAIGVALNQHAIECWVGEERAIMTELGRFRKTMRDPTWVGHNCAGFDLPWLRMAAIKHRQPFGEWMPMKRFDKYVDTMDLWTGTDWRGYASLQDIATYLGLGDKHTDSSKIYELWQAGKQDEIRQHCIRDVGLTREIFLRMRPHALK